MILVLDQCIHVQVEYLFQFLSNAKASLRISVTDVPHGEHIIFQPCRQDTSNNIGHFEGLPNACDEQVLPHAVDVAL